MLLKSVAFVPVTATLLMFNASALVLKSVTVCRAFLVPTTWSPKPRLGDETPIVLPLMFNKQMILERAKNQPSGPENEPLATSLARRFLERCRFVRLCIWPKPKFERRGLAHGCSSAYTKVRGTGAGLWRKARH